MHLLLVEDDAELARQTKLWLREAGHACTHVDRAETALRLLAKEAFDAAIFDVGLPDMDGFTAVEQMRARGFGVPVLFLTARGDVTDRVRGFKAGGDQYVIKPFAVEELLARLEAMERRSGAPPHAGIRQFGRWAMDPVKRRLREGENVVELQPREWTLLEVLLANEGRTLTKKFLLEKVWDIQFDPGTNVVDAMICRLRRKIDTPGQPSHLQTVRGKGYVFKTVP
ncbi:MAG: response regulator transcription factor [Prosthecobacter sp.]|jgi:DNA-binding response OmpR family regulator|uniref:response regulator transcription factor n=1 Tax=Prosthecobacter sp. TaxID=1965333 RepID=UPI0019FC4C25|nr:response regulator transcription factor [Prosthecobacter sp.]MBE2286992.1 response regulator transcription factor [Prosthecobacter sp.]